VRFENRVVVVTGGAQGIGLGAARRLLAEGARVALLDISEDALGAASESLRADRDRVLTFAVDTTHRDQVHDAVTAVRERWERVDVLVAAAGVVEIAPLLSVTDASWNRIVQVNLTGTFVCVQEVARNMSRGGAIVVIASTNASYVEAGTAHYSATKGALVSFVRAAALDLAPHGIRINAINPGQIRTRLSAVLTEDPVAGPAYLANIPLGRWGEPSDIAAAAAFLASEDAAYITGEAMTVDGGVTLGVALGVSEGPLPGL
jgi:NAD(P)-dependent dehydrogenase (short-subunit alcohol dehydrogenase family)